MNDILLINNKPKGTGIGSYSFSLYNSLKEQTKRDIDLLTLNPSFEAENGSKINAFSQNMGKLLDHFSFTAKIPKSYKIYHLLNPNLGVMLPKLRPSVVTVHDISVFDRGVIKDIIAKSRGLEAPMLLSMQFNMSFIKNADRVICVSNYTKTQVHSVLGVENQRITVTYPGLDTQLFTPRDKLNARLTLGLPLNRKILLHVGTDEPRKNFKTMLEAFCTVRKRIPEAVLVKIGGMREETKNFISQLGLEEAVIYYSKVPSVAPFYNAADLFVFPSYYEGFGYPAAEAMASGCPVIAAGGSSVTEVVGKAGLLFSPFDVAALGEMVNQVLTDSNMRSILIRDGLEQAKLFDWKKCAQTTLELYKTL